MLEGLVVGLPVGGAVLGWEGLAHAVIVPDGRKPRLMQQSPSDVTGFLQIFADLISQLYLLEISAAKNLISTIRIASDIARVRDFETGNHLKRMAEYSALIARNLRAICKLSDEYIEYIHLFSPLHDIGKIGIADSILLKPGCLNPVEKSIMRKHIAIGGMLVKRICHELNIGPGLAMDMMMNIVILVVKISSIIRDGDLALPENSLVA